jgi:hypothetical protein
MTTLRPFGAAVLVAAAALAGAAVGETTLDVGGRKQLFIDTRFVRDGAGVGLRMNPPVKAGVALRGDRPWDAGWVSGAGTVLEEGGRFRMWYSALPEVARFEDDVFRLCYAESRDGIVWEKPNLGLYEWQGSSANNILLETSIENAGGVFLDPSAPPEARYKLLAIGNLPANTPEGRGLYVYTSPDGLRWKLHPRRVFPFVPDTVNIAFFDRRIRRYVAYLRVWDPLRKVGRVEMANILQPWPYDRDAKPTRNWGKGVPAPGREIPTAFGYDAADPVPSDHYTSAVVQYPWADDAYFMFPSPYLHYPPPPKGAHRNDGPLDVQLAVSRDGVTFTRVERAPYIGLGLAGSGDGGSLYMYVGMIRRGPEVYQFYGGVEHTHGAYAGYSRISGVGAAYRVVQRPDGLVSLDAAGPPFRGDPARSERRRLGHGRGSPRNPGRGRAGTCRLRVRGCRPDPSQSSRAGCILERPLGSRGPLRPPGARRLPPPRRQALRFPVLEVVAQPRKVHR